MCLEIEKDRITIHEVVRAMGEYDVPEDHEDELMKLIENKWTVEEIDEAVKDFVYGK